MSPVEEEIMSSCRVSSETNPDITRLNGQRSNRSMLDQKILLWYQMRMPLSRTAILDTELLCGRLTPWTPPYSSAVSNWKMVACIAASWSTASRMRVSPLLWGLKVKSCLVSKHISMCLTISCIWYTAAKTRCYSVQLSDCQAVGQNKCVPEKNSRTTDVTYVIAILKCSRSFIGAGILSGHRKTNTYNRIFYF